MTRCGCIGKSQVPDPPPAGLHVELETLSPIFVLEGSKAKPSRQFDLIASSPIVAIYREHEPVPKVADVN